MHAEINDYIEQIRANDPELTQIVIEDELEKEDLADLQHMLNLITPDHCIEGIKINKVHFNFTIDFSKFPRLTQLHLEECEFEYELNLLPCKELEFLNLISCGLDAAPNLSGNTNLKELLLSQNKIKKINLYVNTRLTYLDLYDNSITELVDLRGLHALEHVDLAGNCMTQFPLFSAGVELQLEYLKLSSNYFEEASFEGLVLPKLTCLVMKYGKLKKIYGLQRLEKLKLCELNENHIIGELAFGSPFLHTLNVADNSLTSLPTGLSESLEYLYASGNHIRKVHLPVLPNLLELCLNGCKIVMILGLSGARSVKYIHLEDNSITQIPQDICKLHNLEVLKLAGNSIQIAVVPSYTVQKVEHGSSSAPMLREIDLSRNKIEVVVLPAQEKWQPLPNICLLDNPLSKLSMTMLNLYNTESERVNGTKACHFVCMDNKSDIQAQDFLDHINIIKRLAKKDAERYFTSCSILLERANEDYTTIRQEILELFTKNTPFGIYAGIAFSRDLATISCLNKLAVDVIATYRAQDLLIMHNLYQIYFSIGLQIFAREKEQKKLCSDYPENPKRLRMH